MVPLQCSYLLPVILAPYMNTYPARNKKNAEAKFKGVILNFILFTFQFISERCHSEPVEGSRVEAIAHHTSRISA